MFLAAAWKFFLALGIAQRALRSVISLPWWLNAALVVCVGVYMLFELPPLLTSTAQGRSAAYDAYESH